MTNTTPYIDPAAAALDAAPDTGLLVHVFRSTSIGDTTNGGVTGKHNALVLLVPGLDAPTEPDYTRPALVFVERYIGGKPAHFAIPAADARMHDAGYTTPMFGGHFVWSSDSRFPTPGPIPVHDRYETWSEYDRMSR